MLPVGQGIVKLQDRFHQSFLVQFPLIDVTKGIMADSVLKEYIKNAKSFRERRFLTQDLASNFRERKTTASVDKRQNFLNDIGVENSPFQLLEDVVQFPEDGVNKRYKRLKLSAENGHAFKQKLLEMNLVTQSSVKSGKTSKLVLSPTANAKKLLLGTKGIDGRASFQHEYWKKWYAKYFEHNDYFTQFEWPRTARDNSGRMDVLA
tara:strand:- start:4855 stop:5472 length:618 start_codon:yes stop_codon:yes gene_type:complete